MTNETRVELGSRHISTLNITWRRRAGPLQWLTADHSPLDVCLRGSYLPRRGQAADQWRQTRRRRGQFVEGNGQNCWADIFVFSVVLSVTSSTRLVSNGLFSIRYGGKADNSSLTGGLGTTLIQRHHSGATDTKTGGKILRQYSAGRGTGGDHALSRISSQFSTERHSVGRYICFWVYAAEVIA